MIIFKSAVKAAGTPGPLLGDNDVTSLVTLLKGDLKETNSLGTRTSVFNQTTRQHYAVRRVTLYAMSANTNGIHFGAAGSPLADMIERDVASEPIVLGNGVSADVDLGDIDIDGDASGNEWLVIVES